MQQRHTCTPENTARPPNGTGAEDGEGNSPRHGRSARRPAAGSRERRGTAREDEIKNGPEVSSLQIFPGNSLCSRVDVLANGEARSSRRSTNASAVAAARAIFPHPSVLLVNECHRCLPSIEVGSIEFVSYGLMAEENF